MTTKGISKRWHKAFLVKELASRVPERANLSAERLADSLAWHSKNRDRFINYVDGSGELTFFDAMRGLELYARQLVRSSELDIYEAVNPSLERFECAVGYWSLQRLLYLGRNMSMLGKSNIWRTTFCDIGETLSMTYSMGWNLIGDRIGEWTLKLLPLDLCWSKDDWDPRWEKRREPFARFAIALYADFAGAAKPAMPPHPYESPVYDTLMANWRNPDANVLIEPLLAACDWHTQECMYSRSDKPSKNVDFINDVLMGWPVEVHMVYRLRERLGLALPSPLNHPLMQTPFGAYRSPQPIPQDTLIQRLTQRAFADIPDLRDLVEPALTIGIP